MKCKKCQKEMEAGWKYCPECSEKAEPPAQCASCRKELEAGWKFCPECNAKVEAAPVEEKETLPENRPQSRSVLYNLMPEKKKEENTKAALRCQSCNAEIQSDTVFCGNCGSKVEAPPVEEETLPPQAVKKGRLEGETAVSKSGIKTVWIPAGAFLMGSPAVEEGRQNDESPQRRVTISKGFWMCVYPVTQEEWTRVMLGNPSYFHTNPAGEEKQGRRPVESVSWYDAIEFANRLSILEGLSPAYSVGGSTNPDDWGTAPAGTDGKWDAAETVPDSQGWRLPTEAQWEYAARAGTVTAFSNGAANWKDEASIKDIGWFTFNSGEMTHEVGLKQPNPWGLHDMHGNVLEWCWDWYNDKYPSQAQTDPAGASSGSFRVFRGGCWNDSAQDSRSAFRGGYFPRIGQVMGLRLLCP